MVDIGGSTSDFALCNRTQGNTELLASGGLRLGGTDFDRVLSLADAMPLLGRGSEIGAEFRSQAPTAPFPRSRQLRKIAFFYDADLLREGRRWIRLARDPALFERLAEVLESHLGHDIAYAVEAAKIDANRAPTGNIALGMIERGFSAEITQTAMETTLAADADAIGREALATLDHAGIKPGSVDQVVYIGGSSLMGVIRTTLTRALPDARQEDAAIFTAVVHGLVIAAGRPNA
ncbi:MAG: hypothetical protein GDA40_08485 [Rhodobacteraceae bacterium]|nr:hypothetical protein [Paracoccaceae bacterium]